MNTAYRIKNSILLKTFIIFVFLAVFLTGKIKTSYAANLPNFSLNILEKQLKTNKPFEITFTLSCKGDASAFNIKSFTFAPSKEIEIIKSSSITNTYIDDLDQAFTSTVFSYTLNTKETSIALPQTELLLTDANEKIITLNTQKKFLTLKLKSQIFKNTVTKIKNNKMILWIIIAILIIGLFFTIIIADYILGKSKNK